MDYQKVYDAIILRFKRTAPLIGEYSEIHHIIPRCMGGEDAEYNLVALPARYHFIAHQCLAKIHKDAFGGKLIIAAFLMSKDGKHGSRDYAWLRKQYVATQRTNLKGNKNSLGFKHSEETRAKLSKARMGNQNAKGNKGRVAYNEGKKHSPETIEKMRLAHMGNKPSEKAVQMLRERSMGNNYGAVNKGKKKGPMSQEQKDRIAQTMREVRASRNWSTRKALSSGENPATV